MELLFEGRNQHISAHCAPELGFYGVLAGAEKVLDTQVLLDPFEKQFDLPAAFVKIGNGGSWQHRFVGQKDQRFLAGVFESDAPDVLGMVYGRVVALEFDSLIGNHFARSVGRIRIDPADVKRGLGPCDKECPGLMQAKQPLKIQIAPIDDLKGSGLEGQHEEYLGDVVLSVGDIDKRSDCAPQIQKDVDFDGRLGGTKQCPGKQTYAQIDGTRIHGEHGVLKIEPELLACVALMSFANQHRNQIDPDLPVPALVGIGNRYASDRSPKTDTVKFAWVGTKACLDVVKRLVLSQLRKCHYPKVLGCRQRSHSDVAPVAIDNARKACPKNELHDLRKHRFAKAHGKSPDLVAILQSYPVLAVCRSNRHQTKCSLTQVRKRSR